jgi:hypothetical protein
LFRVGDRAWPAWSNGARKKWWITIWLLKPEAAAGPREGRDVR